MSDLINKHKQEINQICHDIGIKYLAVFGSQARNDARIDSDVDLLIEFKRTPGLIEFVRIKHLFEDILDRRVDLITKKNLSRHISPFVNKDIQQIYG